MNEGAFGMNEEHVGHPDLLHQTAVKRHALIVGAGEGQAFIFPVMPQIQRHGKVLTETLRG